MQVVRFALPCRTRAGTFVELDSVKHKPPTLINSVRALGIPARSSDGKMPYRVSTLVARAGGQLSEPLLEVGTLLAPRGLVAASVSQTGYVILTDRLHDEVIVAVKVDRAEYEHDDVGVRDRSLVDAAAKALGLDEPAVSLATAPAVHREATDALRSARSYMRSQSVELSAGAER